MRSTNIYQTHNNSIDLVIDGSSLYDITIDKYLNDIDMSSIYNKTLSNPYLLLDANVTGKTMTYVRDLEDYSVVTNIVPISGTTAPSYFSYQYITSGYTLFNKRFEKGWTAEFIVDTTNLNFTGDGKNILFYMGKFYNDMYTGTTKNYFDNNFTIYLDEQKQLVFKQIKFESTCDCSDEVISATTVVQRTSPLPLTGNTKHHLVIIFERYVTFTGLNLETKGISLDCAVFPTKSWFDGRKHRLGKIKVYLNGLLVSTIMGVEEPIFSDSEPLPFVQSWGISDDVLYDWTALYENDGFFTGTVIRGRFYETTLPFEVIRNNFTLFSTEYNITNPLSTC